MTAGTLPARRVRRAPPLPNSVRVSADSRTSDTAMLLEKFSYFGLGLGVQRSASDAGTRVDDRHRVDHGSRVRSLAGQPPHPTRSTGPLRTQVAADSRVSRTITGG